MFKRFRWMSFGAAVGLGGSVWAQRRVRRTVERYLPEQVGAKVADRARGLRADLADALEEGRLAMRDREAELRAQRPRPAPAGSLPAAASGPSRDPDGPVIDVAEGSGQPSSAAKRRQPSRAGRARHRRVARG